MQNRFFTRRQVLLGAGLSLSAPVPARPGRGAPDFEPPALALPREAPPDADPVGFLVSEKYDGVRAFWDGERLQLRSGRAVAAPAWFTQGWPAQPLDGELWLGRGRFDALAAAVRRQSPREDEWRHLRCMAFDLPGAPGAFAQRAQALAELAGQGDAGTLVAAPQATLPDRAALQWRLREVVAAGGEGLVLHRADAPWRPGRSDALLKLKPQQDAEGRVLAQLFGRTGRVAGLLTGLRLRIEGGREFVLGSGFSDALRRAPPPVGSVVTFRHRGWSGGGLPRFASFLRVDPGL